LESPVEIVHAVISAPNPNAVSNASVFAALAF
jgi:hypothetical protein